jgi:hypothetical protein
MPIITKPNQHFDVLTYAGSASNQTISGLNFQPDFIWFKERTTNGIPHNLFDSARSNYGSRLISSATSAEAVSSAIVSVSSTGYTLTGGASTTNDASGRTYVTWNWKAGGAAVTNTAGSISSQVSVNPTAGFSIVTYTGNATSGATVGHGLGVAPSFIIAKNRSSGSTDWPTFHVSTGNNGGCTLNEALAKATTGIWWNNTTPSSTVVTLGNGAQTNGSTNSQLLYCWTPVAGYSAFGSYTGNGSTDGPFVYLGFEPRFILIKSSSNAERWLMWDTARDTFNIIGKDLVPNTDAAESGAGSAMDILSNGFKLRSVASSAYNFNGYTYIYAAFAEAPFKFANAR